MSLDTNSYTVTLSALEIKMLILAIETQSAIQMRSHNQNALLSAKAKLLPCYEQADKEIRQNFESWLRSDDESN